MGASLSRYLQSYLGMLRALLPPSAQEHRSPRPRPARCPRDPGLRRAPCSRLQQRWAATGPLHARGHRATGPQPARPRPRRLPLWLVLRPDLTRARHLYQLRRRREARCPRSSCDLVKVQINPPQRPESLYRCPRPEPVPDPCDRDVVLKALAQNNKGKKKLDDQLWFEVPEPKRRCPEPRPSAFQPRARNGVDRPFVPRPGPLRSSSPAPRSVRRRLSFSMTDSSLP